MSIILFISTHLKGLNIRFNFYSWRLYTARLVCFLSSFFFKNKINPNDYYYTRIEVWKYYFIIMYRHCQLWSLVHFEIWKSYMTWNEKGGVERLDSEALGKELTCMTIYVQYVHCEGTWQAQRCHSFVNAMNSHIVFRPGSVWGFGLVRDFDVIRVKSSQRIDIESLISFG